MQDMKDLFHPLIYIVIYSTGEYENTYKQNLGFFLHKEDADAMVVKLEAEYSDWDDQVDDGNGGTHNKYYNDDYHQGKTVCIHVDYIGPSFHIQTLKNIRNLL